MVQALFYIHQKKKKKKKILFVSLASFFFSSIFTVLKKILAVKLKASDANSLLLKTVHKMCQN